MNTQLWIQIIVYAVGIGVLYGNFSTKLKSLEKKMDKHNGLVEKTYKAESDIKHIQEDICELKGVAYHE